MKNAEFDLLVDIGLTENGHIIAVKKDGTGRIVKLVEDGVKSVHEFKDDVNQSSMDHCWTSMLTHTLFADTRGTPSFTGIHRQH